MSTPQSTIDHKLLWQQQTHIAEKYEKLIETLRDKLTVKTKENELLNLSFSKLEKSAKQYAENVK